MPRRRHHWFAHLPQLFMRRHRRLSSMRHRRRLSMRRHRRRLSMRHRRRRSSMRRHRRRLSMRRHRRRLSMRRHRHRSFVRRQRRSTRRCAEIPDDRHAPSRHQGVRPALKAHWGATSRGFQPSATPSANGRSLREAAGWNRREADIADRRWDVEKSCGARSPRDGKRGAVGDVFLGQRDSTAPWLVAPRRSSFFLAAHQHSKPPSTSRSTPVMNDAAGLNRKIAGPTISSTVAIRAIGVSAANTFSCSATSGRLFIAVRV